MLHLCPQSCLILYTKASLWQTLPLLSDWISPKNSLKNLDSSSDLCWDRRKGRKQPLAGWRAVGEGQELFFKACILNSGILADHLMEVENWLYQSNQTTRQDLICMESSGTPGLTACRPLSPCLHKTDIITLYHCVSQVTNTVFQMFLS